VIPCRLRPREVTGEAEWRCAMPETSRLSASALTRWPEGRWGILLFCVIIRDSPRRQVPRDLVDQNANWTWLINELWEGEMDERTE
jgi:hypothetical protein